MYFLFFCFFISYLCIVIINFHYNLNDSFWSCFRPYSSPMKNLVIFCWHELLQFVCKCYTIVVSGAGCYYFKSYKGLYTQSSWIDIHYINIYIFHIICIKINEWIFISFHIIITSMIIFLSYSLRKKAQQKYNVSFVFFCFPNSTLICNKELFVFSRRFFCWEMS